MDDPADPGDPQTGTQLSRLQTAFEAATSPRHVAMPLKKENIRAS